MAEDFEVRGVGKPQQLTMVSLMQPGVASPLLTAATSSNSMHSTSAVGTSPANAVVGSAITPTVTAILLDNLSADTRPLVCRAAALFVEGLQSPNEYAGIFVGGLAFKPLQPFTNSIEQLRQAVRVAATTASDNLSIASDNLSINGARQNITTTHSGAGPGFAGNSRRRVHHGLYDDR
jgi:hypothetical protein